MTDPQPAGFRPRDRLRRPADFERVMRDGLRVADGGFSLRWLARAVPGQRLGVVIPRQAGPAVLRNKTRRVIREVFRLGRRAFPDGADVIVVVRRGLDLRRLRPAAIRQAIGHLAVRARAAQEK